jgi:hypothetical protein
MLMNAARFRTPSIRRLLSLLLVASCVMLALFTSGLGHNHSSDANGTRHGTCISCQAQLTAVGSAVPITLTVSILTVASLDALQPAEAPRHAAPTPTLARAPPLA